MPGRYILARYQAWEEIDGETHKHLYWSGEAWTGTYADAAEYPLATARNLAEGFREDGEGCAVQPVHSMEEVPGRA